MIHKLVFHGGSQDGHEIPDHKKEPEEEFKFSIAVDKKSKKLPSHVYAIYKCKQKLEIKGGYVYRYDYIETRR